MWHLATVVFGRTDAVFWSMTPAQIDLLASAHLAWQGATEEPEDGDPSELIDLIRRTNRR